NSWNCGAEGDTKDPGIMELRKKMMRNAFTVLMCSRGTPMFLAGDEFCNTQFGNNNPYCQDNEISWLDWGLLKKNKDVFSYFKKAIAFRKAHPAIRKKLGQCGFGFPQTSFHGVEPWQDQFQSYDHYLGVMFAGKELHGEDDIVYVAVNSYWEDLQIRLPELPEGHVWRVALDTEKEPMKDGTMVGCCFTIKARSVMVFTCGE
ncbi:MAG: glycogen debranching enzyme, partial [Lachnospiraceae bacterium]|nr:glycogen debranching enzyme [Lachnospiraceae bacterium]